MIYEFWVNVLLQRNMITDCTLGRRKRNREIERWRKIHWLRVNILLCTDPHVVAECVTLVWECAKGTQQSDCSAYHPDATPFLCICEKPTCWKNIPEWDHIYGVQGPSPEILSQKRPCLNFTCTFDWGACRTGKERADAVLQIHTLKRYCEKNASQLFIYFSK